MAHETEFGHGPTWVASFKAAEWLLRFIGLKGIAKDQTPNPHTHHEKPDNPRAPRKAGLAPAVFFAQAVGNSFETLAGDDGTLAADMQFGHFQHFVQTHPTLAASFVPGAGADI